MSQIKLIVYFLDNSPPRQVKRPNLERNEGGVDNGSYDNDDSNFPAPTRNDTTYQGVCDHTSMQQGIFCSKNPHTAKIKLGPEWSLPSRHQLGRCFLGKCISSVKNGP